MTVRMGGHVALKKRSETGARVLAGALACLLAGLAQTAMAGSLEEASSAIIVGEWTPPKMDAAITIAPCAEGVCATLTRHAYGDLAERDELNPDPALRERSLIGATILKGLRPASANKWRGGALYDPRTGKTYASKMKLLDPNHLKITACVGPGLCKGYVWTRIAPGDPLKPSPELIAMADGGASLLAGR